MATNDAPERREKVVMALGLVAIILFSANLMAMVARHFWPNMPIIGEPRTEEIVVESLHLAPHVVWEVQTDELERDLRRLEYRIARERASLDASASGHLRLNDARNKFQIRVERLTEQAAHRAARQAAEQAAEDGVAAGIAANVAARIATGAQTQRILIRDKSPD